ncbi:class I SAM-dependent methyltransferase [Candidatus Galacturonibacter soehngenii]|uniref:Class I SAM-dependent methyltransferase n=1 Tax=Candidatus Galacturonatibacter soehngenii TaxID=2307010 RepID=A0A7V7UCX6_9FIRM|nr:class I SAM-dependent methyltransferase [Candidatus Galacturonibacter soehngenii]
MVCVGGLQFELEEVFTLNVITHYDKLIDDNNDPFRDPPPLRKYMDKWDGQVFIDSMRLSRTKKVLEIGIGTGRIAAKVAPLCVKLVGIDISPKTIKRAKENLSDFNNIEFVCANFSDYVFDETFDVIYSSLTMMHFEDKQQIIVKVNELLNENGIFCLSIDKNLNDYIDMSDYKLKIYPDNLDNISKYINLTEMNIINQFETDFAYIFICMK